MTLNHTKSDLFVIGGVFLLWKLIKLELMRKQQRYKPAENLKIDK